MSCLFVLFLLFLKLFNLFCKAASNDRPCWAFLAACASACRYRTVYAVIWANKDACLLYFVVVLCTCYLRYVSMPKYNAYSHQPSTGRGFVYSADADADFVYSAFSV